MTSVCSPGETQGLPNRPAHARPLVIDGRSIRQGLRGFRRIALLALCCLTQPMAPVLAGPTSGIPIVIPPSSTPRAVAARIGAALANDRALSRLTISVEAPAVRVQMGNRFGFDSYEDEPDAVGTALLARVARALDREKGDVQVRTCVAPGSLAHHDHFRSEDDLAMARAEKISQVLRPLLSSPGRILPLPEVAADRLSGAGGTARATGCEALAILLAPHRR